MTNSKYIKIISEFNNKKILVIGDLTVDKYILGYVNTISPDAPVPLLHQTSEKLMLGGAANVVQNILSMGGKACVCGIVGNDNEGRFLLDSFRTMYADISGIFTTHDNPTTITTRINANSQQLLRIDREEAGEIDSSIVHNIINFVRQNITSIDAIVISDHGKGLITPEMMRLLVSIVGKNKPIVVKPSKKNIFSYQNVTIIAPNRKAAGEVIGLKILNETSIRNAGLKIVKMLDAEAVLITWIEEGFHLFNKKGEVKFLESGLVHVVNLVGYWDAVSSSLALSLSCGATIEDAATVALNAAEIYASKKIITPVNYDELVTKLRDK